MLANKMPVAGISSTVPGTSRHQSHSCYYLGSENGATFTTPSFPDNSTAPLGTRSPVGSVRGTYAPRSPCRAPAESPSPRLCYPKARRNPRNTATRATPQIASSLSGLSTYTLLEGHRGYLLFGLGPSGVCLPAHPLGRFTLRPLFYQFYPNFTTYIPIFSYIVANSC